MEKNESRLFSVEHFFFFLKLKWLWTPKVGMEKEKKTKPANQHCQSSGILKNSSFNRYFQQSNIGFLQSIAQGFMCDLKFETKKSPFRLPL
jgi:hypothetical protein